MEQNRKSSNTHTHTNTETDFQHRYKGNAVEKGESFQQMVLEQLDNRMEGKNELHTCGRQNNAFLTMSTP